MSKTFDAVIFDLDGTLIDSAPDLGAALNLVLDRRGLAPLPVKDVRLMIGAGVPKLIERGFKAHGVDLPMAEIEAELLARFLAYYNAHSTDLTTLYPGAKAAVEYLASTNTRIGMCTNKPTEAACQILDGLGIGRHFHTVLGGSSGFPKKPDPAVVHACLEAMGSRAADACYVGDSETDVKTARNAGVPIIVVAGGYTATPAEQLGGDITIDTLNDLPGAVTRLGALGSNIAAS